MYNKFAHLQQLFCDIELLQYGYNFVDGMHVDNL